MNHPRLLKFLINSWEFMLKTIFAELLHDSDFMLLSFKSVVSQSCQGCKPLYGRLGFADTLLRRSMFPFQFQTEIVLCQGLLVFAEMLIGSR